MSDTITVTMTEDRFVNRRTGEVTMYPPENVRHRSYEVRFDGSVYRWASNNQVPPSDAIRELGIDQHPGFDANATDAARDAETAHAIKAYRDAQRNAGPPSGEQLAEMRNVFGSGAIVVDVISGRKLRL